MSDKLINNGVTKKVITYQEILGIGKTIFNFHPDEDFESVEDILTHAKKVIKSSLSYEIAASVYADHMSEYIDRLEQANE